MKAIVAEDEIIIALDIASVLKRLGYIVPCVVSSGEDLIKTYFKYNPDLIITDIMLKGEIDGLSAAKVIKENKNIPILFVSGFSDPNFYKEAQKISPNGLVGKPFNPYNLKTKLDTLLGN